MRIIASLGIVGAAVTAVLHFTYPAVAAAGCPSCYGFTDLGDGIYVEGGMPLDRQSIADDHSHRIPDRRRVGNAGTDEPTPDWGEHHDDRHQRAHDLGECKT